jgi:hypothetical protein
MFNISAGTPLLWAELMRRKDFTVSLILHAELFFLPYICMEFSLQWKTFRRRLLIWAWAWRFQFCGPFLAKYEDEKSITRTRIGEYGSIMALSSLLRRALRPDSTSAFSRRNANYFACFFWIATTRINYFYLIAHNSKETGEIFRISPRKSARGIRPLRIFSKIT